MSVLTVELPTNKAVEFATTFVPTLKTVELANTLTVELPSENTESEIVILPTVSCVPCKLMLPAWMVVLTVLLPMKIVDVLILTLAPTLTAVETLTVAGNLAVFNVPLAILSAFAANDVALV